MNWYMQVLKKYADFNGRARRMEYWMFVLFNMLISIGLAVLDRVLGTTSESGSGLFSSLYGLAVFIPSLAVAVRRLHDTSRSGWWMLLAFIPILGWIPLLVFMCMDSHPANEYGPNPKEVA